MSEEEIIKIIKYMLKNKNTDINVIINYEAIQGLLDLYNKEKEINADLVKTRIEDLQELNRIQQEDFISKDKIREKIEELEQIKATALTNRTIEMMNDKISILNLILEE